MITEEIIEKVKNLRIKYITIDEYGRIYGHVRKPSFYCGYWLTREEDTNNENFGRGFYLGELYKPKIIDLDKGFSMPSVMPDLIEKAKAFRFNYIAEDKDGAIWAFAKRPTNIRSLGIWCSAKIHDDSDFGVEVKAACKKEVKNWKDSLIKIKYCKKGKQK